MEFFRHCPGCGRRFHIKLVDKKIVHLERSISSEITPRTSFTQFRGSPALVVQEGRPIVTDTEEFQYHYKCGHCGHEWSERHFETQKED